MSGPVYYSFSSENIRPVPDAEPVTEVKAHAGSIEITMRGYRLGESDDLSWWVTDEREVPPVEPVEPQRVPREARIEWVNVLLHDATDRRRLFIANREDGRPAAPVLAHSLATQSRDECGFAEWGVDPRADLTAAIGRALFGTCPWNRQVRH